MKCIALYITPQAKLVCERIAAILGRNLAVQRILPGGLNKTFKEAMKYDALIAVMATGIVVRGIAPFLKNKTKDPAVVVIDEKGQNVISLLSGHEGGANSLALEIAALLKANPVITTASDVNNLPAVDVFAAENNYRISDRHICKKVAMGIIRGEKVGVFLDAGQGHPDFFKNPSFKLFKTLRGLLNYKGYKIYAGLKGLSGEDVLSLVPRCLVAGMGFHRGEGADALFDFLSKACHKHGLSPLGIKKIATIERRKGEKGLRGLCERLEAEVVYYGSRELESVEAVLKNDTVKKHVGTGSVAEACAFLASGGGKVVVPKEKGGRFTVCVALEK